MPGATATFLNNVLDLYFDNVDHANIGDAAGLQNSAADGSFYISLHDTDPVAGNQSTGETTYTGYGNRVAVGRTAGWTVNAANVSNAAAVTFPACTGGSGDIDFVGIGSDQTGTGNLFFSCSVTSPAGGLAVSDGITPEIGANNLDVDLTTS